MMRETIRRMGRNMGGIELDDSCALFRFESTNNFSSQTCLPLILRETRDTLKLNQNSRILLSCWICKTTAICHLEVFSSEEFRTRQ